MSDEVTLLKRSGGASTPQDQRWLRPVISSPHLTSPAGRGIFRSGLRRSLVPSRRTLAAYREGASNAAEPLNSASHELAGARASSCIPANRTGCGVMLRVRKPSHRSRRTGGNRGSGRGIDGRGTYAGQFVSRAPRSDVRRRDKESASLTSRSSWRRGFNRQPTQRIESSRSGPGGT